MTFGGRAPVHQPVSYVIRVTQQGGTETADVSPSVEFTQTFAYNGTDGSDGSPQTLTIPAGVTRLLIEGVGGSGSGTSTQYGPGGLFVATLDVEEGETFEVRIGGSPDNLAAGGYNGGGTPATATDHGGGGATDIRTTPFGLTERVYVAGGGGGRGSLNGHGGGGGYTSGGGGQAPAGGNGGLGGSQTAGGTGAHGGSDGTFGVGGASQAAGDGGAGGGGYYGGGGGGQQGGANYSGGGGGSGFINLTRGTAVSMSLTAGAFNAHGSLTVTAIPV